MVIGIDISQIAYEQSGVANFIEAWLENLLKIDTKNKYILFYSSLRKKLKNSEFRNQNYGGKVTIKRFYVPAKILDFLWNRLHIIPIEWLIGDIDFFLSSDWTEPPALRAKKATILYDLIVYKYPYETAKQIVEAQNRKLQWVKKESDIIFCISESTKNDAKKILHIEDDRLRVLYPGI